MARTVRTDIHRPGAIIPAHYRHVMFFALAHSSDGHPMPSWGVDCERESFYVVDGKNADGKPNYKIQFRTHTSTGCCIAAMRKAGVKFVDTGAPGKCSVCGASFIHGAVFAHENGDHLFIGHQCADKYEMMADWSQAEVELDRLDRATAKVIAVEQNRISRAKFLAEKPGLEAALQTEHRIIADIRARFFQQCHLSDKQVALVLKLHNEVTNPKPRIEEVHCAAPVGRVEFTGTVVSVREFEGDWGISLKVTVKVSTPAGTWLAWGTAPRQIIEEAGGELRGATVCVKATLKPGRDAHFAIMSRPIGNVVAKAAEKKAS